MGLFDGTQLILAQAMAGAAARQQVIANNVANANTPDFRRSDLDFRSQLQNAIDAGSMGGLRNLTYRPATDTLSPVQANGNSVGIDAEMAHMSQNALDYQTLVELANARLKMLSTVIGGASS